MLRNAATQICLHCLGGFSQELTWIEVLWILCQVTTCRTSRSHAQVSVDVHFAHAVLDAFNDLSNRYAVSLWHRAAELIDDFQPLLRHGRRTVHHQVGVRDTCVDLFDAADRQGVACGRLGELVRAVGSTDRDRQCVDLCQLDELSSFVSGRSTVGRGSIRLLHRDRLPFHRGRIPKNPSNPIRLRRKRRLRGTFQPRDERC